MSLKYGDELDSVQCMLSGCRRHSAIDDFLSSNISRRIGIDNSTVRAVKSNADTLKWRSLVTRQ